MKKYKCLSANFLKYIAIIAMTIDHAAFVFVNQDSPLYYIMRTIGRLTAPIMCYFISEGFQHTRNRKKYLMRMAVFAFISQPFYFTMVFDRLPQGLGEFLLHLNVMFTFSVSLIMLMIVDNKKIRIENKIILVAVCFAFADLCDWSYIIPAWVLVFYLFKNNFKKQSLAFIGVSVVLMTQRYLPSFESFAEFSCQYGVLLALIPLSMYNGKRGGSKKQVLKKINKWVFYGYYPLHIFFLILTRFF